MQGLGLLDLGLGPFVQGPHARAIGQGPSAWDHSTRPKAQDRWTRAKGLRPVVLQLTSYSVEVTPAPLKMKPRYTLRGTATVSHFEIHEEEMMMFWKDSQRKSRRGSRR